jgi:hypothetical protein
VQPRFLREARGLPAGEFETLRISAGKWRLFSAQKSTGDSGLGKSAAKDLAECKARPLRSTEKSTDRRSAASQPCQLGYSEQEARRLADQAARLRECRNRLSEQ